jgi:hypothetical protein
MVERWSASMSKRDDGEAMIRNLYHTGRTSKCEENEVLLEKEVSIEKYVRRYQI